MSCHVIEMPCTVGIQVRMVEYFVNVRHVINLYNMALTWWLSDRRVLPSDCLCRRRIPWWHRMRFRSHTSYRNSANDIIPAIYYYMMLHILFNLNYFHKTPKLKHLEETRKELHWVSYIIQHEKWTRLRAGRMENWSWSWWPGQKFT